MAVQDVDDDHAQSCMYPGVAPLHDREQALGIPRRASHLRIEQGSPWPALAIVSSRSSGSAANRLPIRVAACRAPVSDDRGVGVEIVCDNLSPSLIVSSGAIDKPCSTIGARMPRARRQNKLRSSVDVRREPRRLIGYPLSSIGPGRSNPIWVSLNILRVHVQRPLCSQKRRLSPMTKIFRLRSGRQK